MMTCFSNPVLIHEILKAEVCWCWLWSLLVLPVFGSSPGLSGQIKAYSNMCFRPGFHPELAFALFCLSATMMTPLNSGCCTDLINLFISPPHAVCHSEVEPLVRSCQRRDTSSDFRRSSVNQHRQATARRQIKPCIARQAVLTELLCFFLGVRVRQDLNDTGAAKITLWTWNSLPFTFV